MQTHREVFREDSGSAGYTLAEMAICLSVIGILMSGALAGTSRYFDAQRTEETHRKIEFVINMLSGYAQTHYRLPCPADPKASPEEAGREQGDGKCSVPEGIVPWKELAIPQEMAVDGWGRYLDYKPASNLTIDTETATVQNVPDACRSNGWYDADGNHLNRAKALFCCGGQRDDHEQDLTVADAQDAASIEPSSGDTTSDSSPHGSFSTAHYMDGPAAPLVQSTATAVTISSRTGGGIVSTLRADQVFAHTGNGSCAAPASANVRPYACVPQSFRGSGSPTIRDTETGAVLPIPSLYGINLALAPKKFQLRATLTKRSDDNDRADSLGFYLVRSDGSIGGVRLVMPDTRKWMKGQTANFTAGYEGGVIGIGLFVIPDGYNQMDGYSNIDLSQLKFVSNYAQVNEKTASITDQTPPVLVAVDSGGLETRIAGADGVSAYHLYGNLNPGRAGRTLRSDTICHGAGEKVGVNHDITCTQPSPMSEAGIDPAHPAFAQIGFEENPAIRCYETKNGGCRPAGQAEDADLLPDGEGGYIASIGDNSYDDIAFSIGLAACPQGM